MAGVNERLCRWVAAVCGLALAASALAPLYGDVSAAEGFIEALRDFSTGADKDTVNNLLGYGAPHAFGLLVGMHHLIVLRRGRPMREIEIAAAVVVLCMAAGAVAACPKRTSPRLCGPPGLRVSSIRPADASCDP